MKEEKYAFKDIVACVGQKDRNRIYNMMRHLGNRSGGRKRRFSIDGLVATCACFRAYDAGMCSGDACRSLHRVAMEALSSGDEPMLSLDENGEWAAVDRENRLPPVSVLIDLRSIKYSVLSVVDPDSVKSFGRVVVGRESLLGIDSIAVIGLSEVAKKIVSEGGITTAVVDLGVAERDSVMRLVENGSFEKCEMRPVANGLTYIVVTSKKKAAREDRPNEEC